MLFESSLLFVIVYPLHLSMFENTDLWIFYIISTSVLLRKMPSKLI